MADFMNKYVKKSRTRSKPVPNKAGSWMSNALKSLGYSSFDVLSDLMPSTVDVAKATTEAAQDLATSLKTVRSTDKTLKQSMEQNYYFGLGKDILKNSLEDLKSGKFYNRDRTDQYFADMDDDFDLGDFDFGDDEDFDSDDFSDSIESDDGNARASFHRKKGGGNDITNIAVSTDIGPDSTLVQATEFQTETTINVGRAIVDNTRIQNRAIMNMVGGMRTEINSSLVSMSDNISQITSVVSESISKHTALSAKYYEDSISIQSQILEHVKQMPIANTNMNTREFKDYNNVMDIISSGGALDFKAYGKLIKKQASNYIESNPFLSQLKFMNDNKEALQITALNPFQKIMTNMVKSAIPKMMQNAMTKFDEQLKETGIAALNQVNGLQRSQNPILSAIGQIFGLQNKITMSKVDKSAYNKGAMSWSGTDHQALTNVIPTLLRKIYASVSGNEEIVFDYDKGVFKNLSEVEKDFDKEKKYHQTSEYSDYKSGFNEFLTKNYAMSPEDKKKFSEDFNTFIGNLVKDQHGGRTFRRGGRDGKQTNENGEELDDIRDLLGGGATSDSKNVQLIRAYLQSLESTDKAALTRFFGANVQEQRATIDRWVKEMQVDPTKYNVMYQQTGLKGANSTNAHLEYGDKNDPSKITGIKSGIAAGVVDKYKHNANYYLREILNTLTTGIYVVPIGGLNGGDSDTDGDSILSAINARRDSVSSKITKEGTKLKTEQAEQTTVKNSYSDEKRQKDIDSGKIDIENDDLTQTQIDVLGNGEARGEDSLNNEDNKGFLSKLADKVPTDTGLGKIIANIRKKRNDAGEKGTGLFNKLNTALFDFVFGTGEKQGGIKGLVSVGINGLKAGFASFGSFLDKKIFQPLNNALFGKDGLVSKIKESDFGKKMSETFGKIKDKMGTFFLGEKDSEGKRSGGLFSETANSLKDIGKNVKESILGKKGPDGKPLPLDQDDSVVGNLRKMFHRVTGSIGESLGVEKSEKPLGTRLNDTIKSAFGRIKERTSDWTNAIFGSGDEEGTTKIFNEKFASEFKEDMSKNKGYIGATTGIGAVASIFLPGGPIGGALLGAGFGIIKKSRGLQELLFGPEDEETGERMGGIINKETQEFFKKHKTGMKVGAIGGLAASVGILPSFFLPGGPIGGALIGTGISLIAKSGAFDELLYGPGGTKEDPTGGLSKKFKEIFGKNKSTKGLALDAGIGAGVGLIGSFFLPGGPILGALIGSAVSVGTATDKFRTWFFGPEGEDGKRHGGIFGKFKGKMQDFFLGKEKDGKRDGGLLTSLKKTAQLAQVKLGKFVEQNMIIPFKNALEPLTESAKKTGAKIKEKFTDFFENIKTKFHNTVTKPVGDAVKKHFIDPMKNFFKKLFSGFGKLIGGIISAPFKMFEAAGKGSYERQKRKGQEAYKDEVDTKLNPFKKENQTLPEKGPFKRIRAFGGAFKNWRSARTDKDVLYEAQFRDEGAGWDRDNERKWDQRVKDRYEESNKKWAAKEAAIRNGYSPKDISTGSGKKSTRQTKATTVDTTPNNFVDAFVNDDNLSKGSKFKASGNSDIDALDIMQGVQVKDKTSINTDIDALDIMMETQGDSSKSGNIRVTKQSRKKNRSGNRRKRNAKRHESKAYEPKTSKPPKVETYKPETTSVNIESDYKPEKPKKDKGLRGKDSNTLLSQIQKDVSKISDSVYGQMNGVGSNVNKIYRLLLKKFGKKDSDIKGDNNKEYVGFWGKIRTALNNPLKAIKNAITAPFRKIKEKISGGLKKVKNFGTKVATGFKNFGKGLKKAGAGLLKGIGSLIKGIGKAAVEAGKVAVDVIHTGLSAVRAILPAVGEALKTGVALIGDGLKAAGSILVTGVKSLGNIVQNAATGFGKLLGGAMSGFGSILSAVGLIGKDVITGIWKGLKFAGKGIVNGVGNLASRIGGKGNGGFGRGKGPFHVIVDSGTLDKVKLVKVVELVKRIGGKNIVDEAANVTGINKSGRTGSMPLNLQFFNKKKTPTESGETSVDNSSNNKDSKKSSLGSIFSETKNKLKGIGEEFRAKIGKRSEDRAKQVGKGSRQSILTRLADRDKEKSENKFKDKVLGLLGRSADAGEKHAFSFLRVFDLKKGLITAGIIMLAPFIIRLFKKFNIGGLISSLASNISVGFKEIGGIKGLLSNIGEFLKRKKNVANGEDTHYKVDEDGNLVYDENGNLVTETTKSSSIKESLTPTTTRINTETGKWENRKDWTNTSEAKVNKGVHVGLKVAKKASKIYNKLKPVGTLAKKAGKKVFDYATLKSDKLATVAIHADDAIKAVKSGGKATFESIKGKAVAKVAGDGGIIEKAILMMQKALDFLVEKFAKLGEKYGVKIAGNNIGLDAVKGILTKSKLGKYVEKISTFVKKIAGKTATSGSTLFLAEIGFAMYGAIDGAANAGALFEVNPKDVDAKMRAIAGVFKALLNTSIGSWVDLINSLVYEILGFSFIKTIASHVYNLLSSDKKQKELSDAQKKFTEDYEGYVKKEYSAYVDDCNEQGIQPMTEDEFRASSLSTTRSEYNSKTNKSLARRVVDAVKGTKKGITSIGSNIKSVFSGNKKSSNKAKNKINDNKNANNSSNDTSVATISKNMGIETDKSSGTGNMRDFLKKLSTYTDPKKSMDDWDNLTMAKNKNDVVGNAASAVIKGIMGIYIKIIRKVREVINSLSLKNIGTTIKDGTKNIFSKIKSFFTNFGKGGDVGGRPLIGGKGGSDELNGSPYYSQNDPKYKNKKYNQTGGYGDSNVDTMGESGCGPTAMAMVASKVTGKDYDPMEMARMSEQGGFSTSLGTSPEYFVNTANKLGISSIAENPSTDNLVTSIGNGDSVILQGVKSSGTNSPFTTDGHYVTVTGLENGNVVVNDPRGKEYSGQYSLSDVLKDSTGMWSFAPGGKGGNTSIVGKFYRGGKGTDLQKWMNIVKAVKEAIAAQKPGYSQSKSISITVSGKTLKVRTDCSGYVGACLKYFGVLSDSTNITSSTVTNKSSKVMLDTGFSPSSFPGWDNLQEGDILGVNGHTEIFAYNKDGQHYVYNCGSDKSTNSAVPTVSGHKSYTTIWRCGSAGTNAVSADGTSSSESSDSSSPSSVTELLSGFASAITNPILESFGLKVNSDETNSDGTSSDGSVTNANVSGSDVAKNVWNYFTNAGYSKAATAGIMGNFSQESGMNPASIQGNGKGPAAGIAQWENYNTKSSRWKELQNYASSKGKDWTDLGSQLEFVNKEMQTKDFQSRISGKVAPSNLTKAGTSGISFDNWKKSTDVEAATRQWEAAYERAGKPAMSNRISAAKKYYSLYGGGKGGSNGGYPIQSTFGGYGDSTHRVSSGSSSMKSSSYDLQKIIETNNISNNLSSSETSQLLNTMISYLSMIVDNTGDTSDKLEELNDKDFGYTTNNNVVNTTNNVSNNSLSQKSSSNSSDKTADRSKYDMAKRVAAGIIS